MTSLLDIEWTTFIFKSYQVKEFLQFLMKGQKAFPRQILEKATHKKNIYNLSHLGMESQDTFPNISV